MAVVGAAAVADRDRSCEARRRACAFRRKRPPWDAVLHRMVATGDVLVDNFRPSVPGTGSVLTIRGLKADQSAARVLWRG